MINTKSGNVAEINLLLVMLMKHAGLQAELVVLSTIRKGLITAYSPSIGILDYVLASVDFNRQLMLYDATSKMTTPGIIRPIALNYTGYIMTDKDVKEINVYCADKSQTFLSVDAKLNPDGTFTGSFSDRDTNLFAMMNSEKYDEDGGAYQKKL